MNGPYPTNHTVPGSILRFDLVSNSSDPYPNIELSFFSSTFDTTEGNLNAADVTFLDSGSNTMPFAQFMAVAESQLYAPCVNLTAVHNA